MLTATLYITICSMRNRTRRWLRRLREPRYFFGLIAVGAYFYFAVFTRMRASMAANRRRRPLPDPTVPILAGIGSAVAGIALLCAAAASWLMPGSGRLFEFSGAELQFLFPAPVPRRQLVIHRLLRSQVGLVFASIVPSLAFSLSSSRSGLGALRTTIAVWLVLVTARVYFSAVTLTRSQLAAPDRRLRRLARVPLFVILGGLLIVGIALSRVFLGQPLGPPEELLRRLNGVSHSGLSGVVLWPCVALAQPLFATTWTEYAVSLAMAACVLAAAMVWVIASDEAFYDVTNQVLERQVVQSQKRSTVYRARKTEWTLAPSGRPEGAFVWKTLMQTLRVIDRRVAQRFVLILLTLSILVVSVSRARGFAGIFGLFAAAGAVYSVLLAPQILRLDLRQDLQHLELLKTWPVRASSVVRGEIMGPALLLTVAAWAFIGLALFMSTAAFAGASVAWRLSIAAGATLLGPTLIFGQYTIHNAMALMFPAWVALGSERPRGLDAMGQRLLTLGGTWVALILMMLPGVLPAAIVWIAFYRFVGPWVIVPASAVCALVIAIEILLMTEALGPAYERLDLLAVERPE